jgi:hypothetical protein
MSVKESVASGVRGADHRVQAFARHSPSIRSFVRVVVIMACALIVLLFAPVAAGLGVTALLLRETPPAYGCTAAIAVMAVLIALVVRFKMKADEILNSVTDLSSLTDFVFDGVFEELQEGIALIGIVLMVVGAAAGAGAHFLGHAWMLPVAVAFAAAGLVELILGSVVALAFRRLVGERLRTRAKEAVNWAREFDDVS